MQKQKQVVRFHQKNQSIALLVLIALFAQLVTSWRLSPAFAQSTSLASTSASPSESSELPEELPEELDDGKDLVKGTAILLDDLRKSLVRAREPRTQLAKLYGGPLSRQDIDNLETLIKIWLDQLRTRPVPFPLDIETEPARAERTVRMVAAGQLIQSLIILGQIRAFAGVPLEPENPRFLDGSPALVELSADVFSAIFAYTYLFVTHETPILGAPHAIQSTEQNQLVANGNAVLFRKQKSGMMQILVKPEILRQIALTAKNQNPTEQNYYTFVRDYTLMQLVQSIGLTSHLLYPSDGAELAKKSVPADTRWTSLIEEQNQKLSSQEAAQNVKAAIFQMLQEARNTWFKKVPDEKIVQLLQTINELLQFAGVLGTIPAATVKTAIVNQILDVADNYASAEELRQANTQLLSLDWTLTPPTTADKNRARQEFDQAHWKAAQIQAPLWRAIQKKWIGKADPIPEWFLQEPVQLPLLLTVLGPKMENMGLKTLTAFQLAFPRQLWSTPTPDRETAVRNWNIAQETYWKTIQAFEGAQSEVRMSATTEEERSALSADAQTLRAHAKDFAFDRGITPSVQELFPGHEEQLAYLNAYLDQIWTEDSLLDPRTDAGAQGELLTQLEKLVSTDLKFDENLHNLMNRALRARLDASVRSFYQVRDSKGPEDLSDLLYVSPHISTLMENIAPGMRSLIAHWRDRHIALSQLGGWKVFSEAYSTPARAFLAMLAVDLTFKVLLRPAGWVTGAALRAGGFSEASVAVRAFLSPNNPFARWSAAVHTELAPYFSRYFAGFLGVIAVDVIHNGSNLVGYMQDATAMQDLYLAQTGGLDFYRHSQLEIRADAARGKQIQFLAGDIFINALLFGGGPLLSRAADAFTSAWEARLLRHWKKLGVSLTDLYNEKGYWSPDFIRRSAETQLASVERKYAARPDLVALHRSEIERARDGLLEAYSAELEHKRIALINFQDAFKTLKIKKPRFNLDLIEAAYQRRVWNLWQSRTRGPQDFKSLARNKVETIRAQRARDSLNRFAEQYARTFRSGTLTEWLANGTMELDRRQAVREAESQVRAWATRAGLDDATTQTYIKSAIQTAEAESAEAWREVHWGESSFVTYQDQLAYGLSRQYEQRGQAAFDFWTEGRAPRVQTQNNYVNYLRPTTPARMQNRWEAYESPYDVLGVSMGASQAEIDTRFAQLIKAPETSSPLSGSTNANAGRFAHMEPASGGNPVTSTSSHQGNLSRFETLGSRTEQIQKIDKTIRPTDPRFPQPHTAEQVLDAFVALSDVETRTAIDSQLLTRWDYLEFNRNKETRKYAQQVVDYMTTPPKYKLLPANTRTKISGLLPAKTGLLPSWEESAFLEKYGSYDLITDYYAELGLQGGASPSEIREAVRAARMEYRNSQKDSGRLDFAQTKQAAEEKFQRVLKAQLKLEDPIFKTWYDYARGHNQGTPAQDWRPTWKR